MTLEKKIEELTFQNGKTVLVSTGEEVRVAMVAEPLFHEIPSSSHSIKEIMKSIEERGEHFKADAYFVGGSMPSSPYIHLEGWYKGERVTQNIKLDLNYRQVIEGARNIDRGRIYKMEIRYDKRTFPVTYFRILERLPK